MPAGAELEGWALPTATGVVLLAKCVLHQRHPL
jgi:hypothetical protein